MWDSLINGSPDKKIAQIVGPDGRVFDVRRRHARMSALLKPSEDGGEVALRHGAPQTYGRFSFDAARERSDKAGNPEKLAVTKEPGVLHTLDATDRLALEMALHEESERRAMQGELGALAAAWEEAEAIAKIADDMLQPEQVSTRLAELRAARDAERERPAP